VDSAEEEDDDAAAAADDARIIRPTPHRGPGSRSMAYQAVDLSLYVDPLIWRLN
jgi:hypothetical protein